MKKLYVLFFTFLTCMSFLQAQIALPYFENFGTIAAANGFPTVAGGAWTRTGTTSTQPTYIANQSYNRSGNGDTKFIAFNWISTTNYYLVGPFSLTSGISYTSSMLYKADGSTGFGPLELRYGTAATGASQTNLIATVPANITNLPFATISGSFTPSVTGSYYMSIKCTSNGDPWYLTLDDFTVSITPTCIAPTGLVSSNITSSSATISWTASATPPADGNDYYYSASNTPPTGMTMPSGSTVAGVTTANLAGLGANTIYYFWVRSNCGSGDLSSWAGFAQFFTGYCTPAPTSVDDQGITNVSFSTVNNTTGAEPGNYGNYSAQIGDVSQGMSTNVNITFKTGYDYDTKVWIDWNDDLDFVDAGEEVYSGTSLSANPTTLVATFTVPVAAPLGQHRMRIGGVDVGPPTSCYTGSYGTYEDYTVNVLAGTPCTGAPTGVTASPASTTACETTSVNFTSGTTSTGTGFTYQWESSPAGAGTFTPISGATMATYAATGIATSTDYHVIITCSGSSTISNTATVTISGSPTNDEACSAITLILDGAADCGNTTCATSVGDPAFSSSTPNNTVWYKYTPTVTGIVQITMSRPAGVTTGLLNAWVGVYTATGTCPTLTFTQQTPALTGFDLTTNATVSVASNSLVAGTTYYLMVDGNLGSFGAFCLQIASPPPAPNCTTNITPVNGATGVSPTPDIPLTWTAAATAASYDVYFGTTNPPTTLITNTPATTTNVTGAGNNNTYYWYVVPKNAAGSAVGCSSSTTSFSTVIAACTPVTIYGGTSGDALIDFVLNGEGVTSISVIGATAVPAPGYTNLTATTTVDLAAGKAYAGNFKTTDLVDFFTIWIDFNNDGNFSASEKVLNSLQSAGYSMTTSYSIMIPASASAGSRVMRVRNIFGVTGSIDACATYNYGEGKDFTVNILSAESASAYVIANPTTGTCANMAQTTIDAASNNLGVLVPVLNASGQLAAMVNAGGDLGVINTSVYINGGSVRTDGKGIKCLDRTITITPANTASAATVRLPYTNAELAALQAVDPTVTAANLNASKFNGIACNAFPSGTGLFLAQSNNGVIGGGNFIDVNITSFSTFFLHGGALPLPVNILSFDAKALKNKTVQLTWNVAAEVDVREYVVERSNDNRNWSAIGSVKASQKSTYGFNDNSPVSGVNYYRLAVKDVNASVAYSDIRTVNFSGKGNMALYPNPANNTLYVSGTDDKNVVVSIYNEVGQIVNTLSSNGETIRTGGIDVSQLLPGAYSIQVKGESGLTTMRFVKQ